MLLMNGLVGDFSFAAKLRGHEKLLSTLIYLDHGGQDYGMHYNVNYSSILMSGVEKMFLNGGKPLYPVERTLLPGGLTEAGVQSLHRGGEVVETPHLDVRYTVTPESKFGGHEELAFGDGM